MATVDYEPNANASRVESWAGRTLQDPRDYSANPSLLPANKVPAVDYLSPVQDILLFLRSWASANQFSPAELGLDESGVASGVGSALSSPPVKRIRRSSENLLINGGFDLAQRQAPATATTVAATSYGPDRWYTNRENADVQYRRYTRDDAGSDFTNLRADSYGRFTKITNSGKVLFMQPIEMRNVPNRLNANTGDPLRLQLALRASAPLGLRVAILEWTGTRDTITKTVSAWGASGADPTFTSASLVKATVRTACAGANWQTFELRHTPSASCRNLCIAIWTDQQIAASTYIEISEVVLRPDDSERWIWMPPDIGAVLQSCQRYFEKSYNVDVVPGTATSNGLNSIITRAAGAANALESPTYFKVQKRTNPTVTLYDDSTNANKISYAGVGANQTGTVLRAGEWGFLVDSDGATAGKTGMLYHFTADAEL